MMPDASEVAGQYQPVRRVFHGFAKIFGYTAIDKYTAHSKLAYTNSGGMNFRQVAPYQYSPTGQSGLQVFTNDQGKVVKTSNAYSDFFPVSGIAAHIVNLSLIGLGIGLLFNVVILAGALIRWLIRMIKRRENRRSGYNMTRHQLWLSDAGVIFLGNTALLLYRAMYYATHSALRIHFIVNILYAVLAAIYLVLLLLKLRHTEHGTARIGYVLSGIVALMYVAVIVGWDLYF